MNRNFNTYMAIGNPSTICSSKAKAIISYNKGSRLCDATLLYNHHNPGQNKFLPGKQLNCNMSVKSIFKVSGNIVIVKHFGHIILWFVQSGVVELLIDLNYVHTNI